MAGLQGRIIGGYELTAPLGSGGVCEVYRGRPMQPGGREVVVKVIPAELARRPGVLPRFQQVTQLAARLASHPHILPLLSSGDEGGALYLISPYVADGTLKDWIARGGRMGTGDAGPFFHQLCDALAYAHSLGVIHGDVKPSNVYLFEGRHVLLGDFGSLLDVAQMEKGRGGPGAEAVAFLAPEVAVGPPTQASDIYGVGAVLFASLTGQPPFHARTPREMLAAHARQPVPHVQQVAPGLPAGVLTLDPVIQRAMAKRPEDRFPSAGALAQAIEMALQQASSPAAAAPGPFVGSLAPGPAAPGSAAAGFAPLGAPGPLGGPGPLGPLGPLGVPAGIGAPAGGFAAAAGAAAPGLFARPGVGSVPRSGLQALNFPPLNGEVDGDMDQGRIIVSPKAPPTSPALRQGTPFGPEPPTMRVPAPVRAPVPAPAQGPVPMPPALVPLPGSPGGPGVGPGPGMPQPAPSARVALPTARPAEGTAGPGPGPGFDGGGYGPQAVPAIRIPPPAPTGRQHSGQHVALAPAGGGMPPLAGDPSEGDDYTGGYSAALDSVESERPFSPTELGLPRLTSPDLRELPVSWQELVRDAPRQRRGEYGGSYRAQQDEQGQWSMELPESGNSTGWGYPGASAEMPSQWADDQQAWASGAPGAQGGQRRRRHWVRWLVVVILLLLVVNLGALVVARPDLCPVSQCASLSTKAHQYLPFLGQPSPTAAVVSGAPATVSISVAPGASATASLSFTDVNSSAVVWSASTTLSWVSVSPNRGSLTPGESATITLTADAHGIAANTYTTTLTISTPGQVLRVPVSITVKVAS